MATSFTVGDNINLTCTVSANNVDEHAMAVVEWRRNGVIIDGTQTTISPTMESSLYNINGTTVHTITGLDSSEEGEYICSSYITSSNDLDIDTVHMNASKSIIIKVTQLCNSIDNTLHLVTLIGDIIITSNPNDIVLDDSTVTLLCSGTLSVSGNMFNNSLHETSIMWYHDGTPVQSTNNTINTLITNTLTIDPFTISSVGDYRCVAMIDNSTAETTTTIRARRKPYLLYLVLFCLHSSTSIISQCNSCRRYLHYRRYSNINMYCNG